MSVYQAMLHTAEIRWFFPEAELASCEGLFPKAPPNDRMNWQETRTDIYRVVPGVDIAGLKVRGNGGLELKALRAAAEDFSWKPEGEFAAEMILGRTDSWVKWELPEASGQKLMADAREIHVRKVRWIRRFSADRGPLRPVYAHGPGSRPDSGCNLERTELTVGQERWLSLGFEAFGAPERTRTILREAVQMAMEQASETEILTLVTAQSESYPAWLNTYVKRVPA